MTAPAKRVARNTAAERMRASRARRQAGLLLVQVPVPAEAIAALIACGALVPDQHKDPAAIGSALLAAVGAAPSAAPITPAVAPVRAAPPGRCYCHGCAGRRPHFDLET